MLITTISGNRLYGHHRLSRFPELLPYSNADSGLQPYHLAPSRGSAVRFHGVLLVWSLLPLRSPRQSVLVPHLPSGHLHRRFPNLHVHGRFWTKVLLVLLDELRVCTERHHLRLDIQCHSPSAC